jgi:hypothetical protein
VDGLATVLERINAAVGPAVAALAGWHWWDEPPDATAVPAGWCELGSGQRWETDSTLYVVTFDVTGAIAHQPSAPSLAAQLAFTDAVLAAVEPSPVNALNPVSVSWNVGEVDIGSVTHSAVVVSVSLLYSTC